MALILDWIGGVFGYRGVDFFVVCFADGSYS